MSLFLKKFETETAYTAAESSLILPNVSLITENNKVAYKPIIHVSSVSLNENALNLYVGQTETLVVTVLPIDATNKNVTWSSSNESVATVDSNGVVSGIATGSCTITVTTTDGGLTAQCTTEIADPYSGHDYVDLGLPSGTKWATMNVGASSAKDYGNYYQYGKGANTYQTTSGQSDYSGTENPLTATADTARQEWGGLWHMPTQAQYRELIDNTTFTFTTMSGVKGCRFIHKTDSSKAIFIPAAGLYNSGSLNNVGGLCYVWSSTPDGSDNVYNLSAYSGGTYLNSGSRNRGLTVRPVVG